MKNMTIRYMLVALFVVTLAPIYASAQRMPQDAWYPTHSWGTTGSGDGQFNAPRGIAVDTNDFVYVSDANNHRIQVFQPD